VRPGAARGGRLARLILLLLPLAVPGPGAATDPPLLAAVGDVTDRGAVLWLRAAGPEPASIEIGPVGAAAWRRLDARPAADADFTVKLWVQGLEPATRHGYRVQWRREAIAGEFVTAPPPDRDAPVTLLWSGDLGGGGRCRSPDGGFPVFRAMAARRPDLFVFAGDTVYADQRCPAPPSVPGADFVAADLAGFRAKHRYQRGDPGLAAFLAGTAVYATWDDHEVRGDFAGPSEPLMPAGRQAFLEYWPVRPAAEEPGRLYRSARWGRLVELLLLDTRQYRSPNAQPDGPEKTMLGAAQRSWLVERLARSDAVWKLVVSSVPLSVPTGRWVRDGWANRRTPLDPAGDETGFEHELLEIVHALAARRVRNVVWLSADVHWAEVLRLTPLPGLVFHELIAGPLRATHGHPRWTDATLGPVRLFAEGGYDNFGELRAEASGLTVRILDAGGRVRFRTVLAPVPPA
jgi:alkaline phosphatase D